jgi:hypothetical protein
MTANVIPNFPPAAPVADGFNPLKLTTQDVCTDSGWALLNEGEPLRSGDGFWNPQYEMWLCYENRPSIFRGEGNENVHTWPWRRRAVQ